MLYAAVTLHSKKSKVCVPDLARPKQFNPLHVQYFSFNIATVHHFDTVNDLYMVETRHICGFHLNQDAYLLKRLMCKHLPLFTS